MKEFYLLYFTLICFHKNILLWFSIQFSKHCTFRFKVSPSKTVQQWEGWEKDELLVFLLVNSTPYAEDSGILLSNFSRLVFCPVPSSSSTFFFAWLILCEEDIRFQLLLLPHPYVFYGFPLLPFSDSFHVALWWWSFPPPRWKLRTNGGRIAFSGCLCRTLSYIIQARNAPIFPSPGILVVESLEGESVSTVGCTGYLSWAWARWLQASTVCRRAVNRVRRDIYLSLLLGGIHGERELNGGPIFHTRWARAVVCVQGFFLETIT